MTRPAVSAPAGRLLALPVLVAAVLLVLTPTGAHLARDVLHPPRLRPDSVERRGIREPSCPDGVAYAIPAALVLIGGPGLAFTGALVCGMPH